MARRLALATGVLGLVLLAALLLVPFATQQRVLSGTFPQPVPLVTTTFVPLPAGGRACLDAAAIDRFSAQAHFRVNTSGMPPVPLTLTVAGAGYRASARVPATYADQVLQSVDLTPPARATEVRICLANAGRRSVLLFGASDRTETRSHTTVDGRRQVVNFDVWFTERHPASLADRAGTVMGRIATFLPAIAGPWLLWILLVLVALGVPAGVVLALDRALRDDRVS